MPVSPAPKPEPVTVIELPAGALVGLAEMVGVTVKYLSGTALAAVEKPYAPML